MRDQICLPLSSVGYLRISSVASVGQWSLVIDQIQKHWIVVKNSAYLLLCRTSRCRFTAYMA